MKTIKLQIMLLIFVCVGNVLCWGQAPGGLVPINLEFSVSPDKEVYHPGDVITVNVHAYFDRELFEIEQDKEFLIIGRFTVGSTIQAVNPRPNSNRSDWLLLTISESTFSDTLIYLHDASEEVRGSFKIVVQEEFRGLKLRAMGYTLGKKYSNDKLISNSIRINSEKTYYVGIRFYKGGNRKRLLNPSKNDKLNISDPQGQGYETIDNNSYLGFCERRFCKV